MYLGPVRTLIAREEIVLCAGALGTPRLLQLSGIGSKKDLKAAGVATIVNNPYVGHNMSEHTSVAITYRVNNTNTLDSIFRDPEVLNASMAQWMTNRSGPLAGGLCNHVGWFRLPTNARIFKTIEDPAAPKSSHYELLFSVRIFLHFVRFLIVC